jgi:hypothetical protein
MVRKQEPEFSRVSALTATILNSSPVCMNERPISGFVETLSFTPRNCSLAQEMEE